MDDEFKNLSIASEEDRGRGDTTSAKMGSEAVCSTCGEPNAAKKCKKRHGGCKNKLFCGSECEKQGHKKEAEEDDDDDDKKPVDMAAAKIAKREKKEVKKTKGCRCRYCGGVSLPTGGCLRRTTLCHGVWHR